MDHLHVIQETKFQPKPKNLLVILQKTDDQKWKVNGHANQKRHVGVLTVLILQCVFLILTSSPCLIIPEALYGLMQTLSPVRGWKVLGGKGIAFNDNIETKVEGQQITGSSRDNLLFHKTDYVVNLF